MLTARYTGGWAVLFMRQPQTFGFCYYVGDQGAIWGMDSSRLPKPMPSGGGSGVGMEEARERRWQPGVRMERGLAGPQTQMS